jgi:hypothetical protein
MFIADFKEVFQAFRTPEVGWKMIVTKNMYIEEILPAGVVLKLTIKEMNHYREPFRRPAEPQTGLALAQRDSHRRETGRRGKDRGKV